jgi:hypothetical protein
MKYFSLFLFVILFHLSLMAQTSISVLPAAPTAKVVTGKLGLKYTFVSNTLLQPNLDNEPNHRVKVENIGTNIKTSVTVSYTGLNADSSMPILSGGGFASFPNGGTVNLRVGDTTIVQGWSSGWRECGCIIDGNNNKLVRFIFTYDSAYYGPDGLRDGDIRIIDTVIQQVTIVQRSQTQLSSLGVIQTTPTQQLKGSFIIPNYIKTSTTLSSLKIATNGYSWNIYNTTPSYVTIIDSVGANKYINFNITVDPRQDYRIEAIFTSSNSNLLIPTSNIVVASASSYTNLSATVLPYGKALFTIDSVKTYESLTGYWRSVFSQGDSTLTVFPGQENWYGSSESDRIAKTANSKIIKFSVANARFGDSLWAYPIPYESWGGATSKDGKWVVYILNQRASQANLHNNTSIDWIGVLDGTTGAKKWGLRGDQSLQEGLEVGISSKGEYIAVGTTGSGRVSIYRNNGSTGTLVWSNPVDYTNGNNNIGQVRKLIFSDNDQFLYAGSGDMYLRKYKVSDGTLVWKAYIGGWPFVNGLAIANGYIVTGTKSKDRTVIRDSDGQIIYLSGAFGYDANVDSTFSGPVVGFGSLVSNNVTGRAIASIGGNAVKYAILNGQFVLMADKEVALYSSTGGNVLTSKTTNIGSGSGEQSQSGWANALGDRIVVTARDLITGVFPRKTVAFQRINRNINRYPTMDSIGSKSFNIGDTLRFKVTYQDFADFNVISSLLTLTATPDTTGLKTIIRGDSVIVYGTSGYTGSGKIVVSITESSTTEKFSVSEKMAVRILCSGPSIPTSNKTSFTYCKNETSTALSATAPSGSTLSWYTLETGGTSSTATPTPITTSAGTNYYYAASSISGCESDTRLKFTIVVNDLPAAPTVSNVSSCVGSSISTLSATASSGNTISWYGNSSTGGTASSTAPTPLSTSVGSMDYYVSQANALTGCESVRSKITVTIGAIPAAPVASNVSVCSGATAVALSATAIAGNTLAWYGNNATGGTASSTANIYSTSTVGSIDYYVSQTTTSTGCESSRTKITVTTNQIPATLTTSPISYCLGATATALTATATSGNNLLWYTSATGGTSASTGPTPLTTIVGSTDYYVSQVTTSSSCEGLRAKLVVTTKAIPSAPTLSRDTANFLLSGAPGTSWFKDGSVITDTTQKYKPATPGSYTAKTTTNGCTSVMSSAYYYLVTDIINLSKDEFIKLAPNPFVNQLNFDFVVKGYQKLNIEVYDVATGSKVANQQNITAGTQIQLGQLARGTYIVRVTSNDNKIAHQFKMVKL